MLLNPITRSADFNSAISAGASFSQYTAKSLRAVDQVTPHVIEGLFAADMAYLQDFYRRINETGANTIEVICPNCKTVFREEIVPLGE